MEGKRHKSEGGAAGWCVAVHTGAGFHGERRAPAYRSLMERALQAAAAVLAADPAGALEAVVAAIGALEQDEITNAGAGSNLTEDGTAEADACVAWGAELHGARSGAVGAAQGLDSPIGVAAELLREARLGMLPGGRVRPMLIAGDGARRWAAKRGLGVAVDGALKSHHVSDGASRRWQEARQTVERCEAKAGQSAEPSAPPLMTSNADGGDVLHDTVGCVAVDSEGNICSGVSSGGTLCKYSGRIGEAAVYGAGAWADGSTGCSCTGMGEEIMQRLLVSLRLYCPAVCALSVDGGPYRRPTVRAASGSARHAWWSGHA